jgi:branched-chain amino acid transport system permease protein
LSRRLNADAHLLPYVAAVVVLFGVFARNDPTLIQAGTYAAIFAVAAIGLSLLLGNVAQISIGQAGFFGIGAYTLAYLTAALSWPSGMPAWFPFVLGTLLGTVLAAAFGLLLGFIALRFRGHYLAMATLAFGLIAVGIFRANKALGGSVGISNVPFAHLGPLTLAGNVAYWYAWGMVALAALLTSNLLKGRTGRAFEAIRNDELAAEATGIPTQRYKILAFAYAGGLAGFAGTFFVSYLGLVEPNAVGVPLSIDLLLMVVLGGAGGVSGATIGASIVGVTNVYGHNLENWRPVIYGIVVIVIVIGFPRGIVGLFSRTRALKPEKLELASTLEPLSATAAPTLPRRWLSIEHVTKRFGGLVAVDDVSFSLDSGTLSSLIGPNGAGKTTLFNAISGIGRVDAGCIVVAGEDVTRWQPHRIAALGVGRSFQNARLFAEMTVLENVAAGTYLIERAGFLSDLLALPVSRQDRRVALERARAVVARFQLEPLSGALARDLSFGDRRRVELARALAANPGLLLLDEPAAGLNARERARLRDDLQTLRSAGITLLLIEHDMRLVMQISDRIMVMRFGKMIADGPPAHVRNDQAVISAYLGTTES